MNSSPVALITGGSKGLGRVLALSLLEQGWTVLTDGRTAETLSRLQSDAQGLAGTLLVTQGDITNTRHRLDLIGAVQTIGRLDVLINSASTLGLTPLPTLAEQTTENLQTVMTTNLLAAHSLTTYALPWLRSAGGTVLNVTSDAAIEAYEGWGAYGASKAALEQWSNILAAEEPELRVYAVDPGDLRTDLHQAAFPGEDISDRPPPDVAVPGFLHLIHRRLPSGRYRAQELAEQNSDRTAPPPGKEAA